MKKALILVAVQCTNCKVAGPVHPPLIIFKESDVITAGVNLHKDSGVICGAPKLMIAYNHAFVSNSVGTEAPESLIHVPNGISSNGNGNGTQQAQPVEEAAPETDGNQGSGKAGLEG